MTERRVAGPWRTLALTTVCVAGCGSPPAAECPVLPAPAAATVAPPVLTAKASPTSERVPAAAAPATADLVVVTVTNSAAVPHGRETVALAEAELKKLAPGLELGKTLVVNAAGAVVLSQVVASTNGGAGELVFQADLAPSEQKVFRLRAGERKLAQSGDYQVYGRFVRERHDDFAWENDLVAHRMYGPDLETTKQEPLVSSGIDVWAKRVPRLLVNEWYMTDDYHQDHGDGADFYAVGKTRGCGGLGIWANEKLAVSRNFTASRVLANGPLRLVFELDYAPWDAGGTKVSETKRITLDAGSSFNRFESTFTAKRTPIPVAIGVSKHPGGVATVDPATASLRVWEPVDGGKNGNLACAVVLPPGSTAAEQQADDNFLLLTPAQPGEPLRYYVGSAWDRAGRVPDAAAWRAEVQNLSARLGSPPRVVLSAGAGATVAPPPATPPAH